MSEPGVRRAAVLAAPLLVSASMTAVFSVLSRLLKPRRAYAAGFVVYWVGWCGIFPLWVLGPRRLARILRRGRPPTAGEAAALALPLFGAVTTELLPWRRAVDRRVASSMAAYAVVNALGEEVLWRGIYLELFPGDVVRGAVWPLAGFVAWHLAPQTILASRHGRTAFLAGAALVGAGQTLAAWRADGLRWTVLPHVLTDGCGVRPALFRLGRI